MERWAVIVSTYGDSENRLRATLTSARSGVKNPPFDLYVRGAFSSYVQYRKQRQVAEEFNATYMESGRWRHWEVACTVDVVRNDMIYFIKDDIVLGNDWLYATDYAWINNENISQLGLSFVEAWEMKNVGLIENEDQMWSFSAPPNVNLRLMVNELAKQKQMRCIFPNMDATQPYLFFGSCPFAWSFRRQDWVDWNATYFCGPGDTSVLHAILGTKRGAIPLLLPYPITMHRRQQSTENYCRDHGVSGLGQLPGQFWRCPELEVEFTRRWGKTFGEVEAKGRQAMFELAVGRKFSFLYGDS